MKSYSSYSFLLILIKYIKKENKPLVSMVNWPFQKNTLVTDLLKKGFLFLLIYKENSYKVIRARIWGKFTISWYRYYD